MWCYRERQAVIREEEKKEEKLVEKPLQENYPTPNSPNLPATPTPGLPCTRAGRPLGAYYIPPGRGGEARPCRRA